MRKTKEETDMTIQRITAIARELFAAKGYTNIALEEIVQEAGLTRGALYHHFTSKKGLFLAVFEEVQRDIARQIETEAMKSTDLWEQLLLGCRAFVVSASEAQNHRILLVDGPAILGWDTFRKMDQQHSMKSLMEHLELLQKQGMIKPISIEAMTHCLSGAMNEAALWIAEHPDRQQAIDQVMDSLRVLLYGFKM
ncbi:TetR/AcrR family transcriptional regulator [Alkalihalobacillus oceani]|uniref:TetR/AcrR family transcriptional regulator n=1 Tax=Halalkalibacter oceani TaxID=1653776 RepID=UPI00203C6F7D|nr:TetR/AcrR family transcriptional regulator [Halalkalibacter oceani]MCM3762898.1 TetR/AcrR family transcriptional regulator [Halalkalibacter oceani]